MSPAVTPNGLMPTRKIAIPAGLSRRTRQRLQYFRGEPAASPSSGLYANTANPRDEGVTPPDQRSTIFTRPGRPRRRRSLPLRYSRPSLPARFSHPSMRIPSPHPDVILALRSLAIIVRTPTAPGRGATSRYYASVNIFAILVLTKSVGVLRQSIASIL